MGKGREAKGRDFPLRKEFDAYLSLRPQFVPGSPQTTLQYQGMKSVSVNADGRESIVVSNKEGQALISCLSGPQYPALPVFGYLSAEATHAVDPDAPVYEDVHIPAAGSQEVKFTRGGSVRIVDLLSDASYDYPVTAATTGVTTASGAYTSRVTSDATYVTLAPGFYRFISLTGTQAAYYEAHYGDFSYTYYDEAGRVIATVAPNGLTPSASTASTSPGPVGYWGLHEGSGTTVADGSGNNQTGTLQNQPVWDANGPPTGGGSLLFDGQASYVAVGDQPALRMGATLSMEAWIYPTGNANGVIINKENEYEIARFPDGSIQWAFQNTIPGWAWVNTGIIAPLNQWSRIGISYDNGKVRAYLNGNQVGNTYNGAGIISYKGSDFRIGGRRDYAQFFQGNLAEVRVWNTVYPVVTIPDPTAAGNVHFITRNTYDTSGRLLATESNDEGRSEYVYAQDGRIRFSQSALQRPAGRFSYSNYDEVGRVVESGEYSPGGTVFENHLTATPAANSVLQTSLLEDRTRAGGLAVASCAQRNQVWYDLAFDGTVTKPDGTIDPDHQDSQLGSRHQEFVVGAVAKTQNDNVTTWYSYDELGRVMWVVQDVAGVGVKTLDYQYDFSGNVLQVAYQKGQADSFYHYYGYDAAQRLTSVYTSPDGATQTLQAQYTYYLHGPLKRVQVAGDLQGVDYVYTLQGALKSINHTTTALEPGQDSPYTNGVQKDLFALTLEYFSGDYRSRGIDVPAPPVPGTPVADRFDGTIRSASWRTGASADIQRMAYTYDEKSQLQNSTYSNWQLISKAYQLNATSTNSFQEGGLSYDSNGNIQTLQRTGATGAVTDNFSYVYKPNTNQLASVHTGSATGATALDYDYDELGQLTRQGDEKGQRYFAYDVTGKTTGVYLDAAHQQPVVTFAYDDRGFRMSKTAYPTGGGPAQATYYVRDVAGNILAVYAQAAPGAPMLRTEVPLYGSGRLGTLTHLADNSDDYRYELNDHLGNARVVFHRPTTTVQVETMELSGVPPQAAFLNDDLYRVAVSGAPSGDYVARMTDSQPAGQELKRVLTVTRGDTITFSALAQWKQNAAAGGSNATPYLLLGAAAGANGFSQRGVDGRGNPYPNTNASWLTQIAAGLGFTIGQSGAASLGATSLEGWIKYRVLDAQGNPMLDAQGQPLAGIDYLLGTGKWEYLQTSVRVPQDGIVEVMAGTSGSGEAVYFDNLRVEQTGNLIVQEQHQYAFGAPMPGLSYTIGNRRYRYGYQGQYAEHDDETSFESFELRMYNSRVGRWLGTDPEGQYDSPYLGMGNNPVSGMDPTGGLNGPGDLGEVIVIGAKATGAWARIGLNAGPAALRAATGFITAYGQYGNSFGATLFDDFFAGAPSRITAPYKGYEQQPRNFPDAAGQFVAHTVGAVWGIANIAVGGLGVGGGGGLSLSGVGATVGAPLAAAGAVDVTYGLAVTRNSWIGLLNSGKAMLNMAKWRGDLDDEDAVGGLDRSQPRSSKPPREPLADETRVEDGPRPETSQKHSDDKISDLPLEIRAKFHDIKKRFGIRRSFTDEEIKKLREGIDPDDIF